MTKLKRYTAALVAAVKKNKLLMAAIPVVLLLAVVLLVAVCSGGGTDETTTTASETTTTSAATTTTESTTTTATLPDFPPSPLNGLGVEDADALDRRVIAVKIDNHWEAQPQSGIEKADAVYELVVEGGLTRFIALFHHSDAEFLGPIRSGRPTDPTLVKPLGAPLQISGAQDWVISLFNNAGVKLLGDNGDTTFRVSTRSAPHNLYGSTVQMRDAADARSYPDDPPLPMFDFGPAPPSDTEAVEIVLDWSDRPEVRWEWDGTQYLRFNGDVPHEWVSEAVARDQVPDDEAATGGDDEPEAGDETTETGEGTAAEDDDEIVEPDRGQIATDTLVVLSAVRYTAGPTSGSGTAVPALETVGEGQATLFYGGVVVEGTWERASIDDPFTLLLPDGSPLTVPPGRLWISVFPDSQTLSWE